MNSNLNEAIRRIDTPAGLKLVFPWRQPPKPLRVVIQNQILIGCCAVVGALIAGGWIVAKPDDYYYPGIALVLTLAVAGTFLGRGIGLMWTRTEIVITADGLRLTEQEGIIRRTHDRPWRRIEKLVT